MGFHAEVHDPYSTSTYRLAWLESDPNYHVVWEEDPTKTLIKPDHHYDEISPALRLQSEVRKLAYEQFRNALGEAPHAASEQSDFHAYLDLLDKKAPGGGEQ